jgi:cytochrome b561
MKQSLGYNRTQIGLHWLTALLVAYNLIIDNSMRPVLRATADGTEPNSGDLLMANLHAWIGIAIFAVVAVRLALRLGHGAPPPPDDMPRPLQIASKLSHWLFYAVLLAMPITGALAYYGGFREMGDVHENGKPILIVLIAVHVGAALWHHFYKKDDVMRRMVKAE